MAKENAKREDKESRHHKRIQEVVNTFDWLITAFILAFVFRAFVMEAFRIPTGSMASTLMGAHFRMGCPQCGWHYDYGFIPESFGFQKDTVPFGSVQLPQTHCPNCGFNNPGGEDISVSNGDRILVLKCLYQFFEPKRWDVVVFKNPVQPEINYIKRLVGRPGEEVEIVDGDVYINGEIARKPRRVQDELWMIVYNNDYQPVRPMEGSFNGHRWKQPFNTAGSTWKSVDARFVLDDMSGLEQMMFYDTNIGNGFQAYYAYNNMNIQTRVPYCSDLKVRFYAEMTETSYIGVSLSKYQNTYKGRVDISGRLSISQIEDDGLETILVETTIKNFSSNKPKLVSFSNVDHQLILEAGSERLVHELGVKPDSLGRRRRIIEPRVEIFGSGKVNLSHVALYRDIHYTGSRGGNGRRGGRAIEGNPLLLKEDQFFVLGDNSPNSEDGRWWESMGKGNNGTFYEAGIVPRDYLVGKAVLVYWPSGFSLEIGSFKSRFAIVPNIGHIRFIFGGQE